MLCVRDVCARYGSRTILDHVSFRLRPHQLTALVGRNGCGKSTLVSCINQCLPYTGEITFSDRSLALMTDRERAQTIAILPQVLPAPHITVEELVTFGRSPYLDLGHRLTLRDHQAVEEAMERAGVAPLRRQMVDQLSGGERQNACLAMVLAQSTRVIVLDEPTTYMDMAHQAAFLKQLHTLKSARKKTILVILHDLNQAIQYADELIVLEQGKVRFQGSAESCLSCGILEEIFDVRKHLFLENGQRFVLFSAD
ncbi:MAG: ABC transporter ATP-binding protein [Intestinimonas sp.]|jgi:iron complex transport system ATP-binding protein|nr:ABC transporter ATP-binding protein [Intestinimonas sp.]